MKGERKQFCMLFYFILISKSKFCSLDNCFIFLGFQQVEL